MNNVSTQENKAGIVIPPSRRRKFGLMGWMLISGLVLLVGVPISTSELDRRTMAWIVFRLDPHYWSLGLIAIFWGIAAWLTCDLVSRFDFIKRNLLRTRIGIIIAVLCWTAWLCGWTDIAFRRQIYYEFYLKCIIEPISAYQVSGTWSWKLLIIPTFGVVTISLLLFIAYQQRKKK